MSMTSAQKTAFETAAGGTVLSSHHLWLGFSLVIFFSFAAWAIYTIYKGWAHGNLKSGLAGSTCIRVCLLLVIVMFFILS